MLKSIMGEFWSIIDTSLVCTLAFKVVFRTLTVFDGCFVNTHYFCFFYKQYSCYILRVFVDFFYDRSDSLAKPAWKDGILFNGQHLKY